MWKTFINFFLTLKDDFLNWTTWTLILLILLAFITVVTSRSLMLSDFKRDRIVFMSVFGPSSWLLPTILAIEYIIFGFIRGVAAWKNIFLIIIKSVWRPDWIWMFRLKISSWPYGPCKFVLIFSWINFEGSLMSLIRAWPCFMQNVF